MSAVNHNDSKLNFKLVLNMYGRDHIVVGFITTCAISAYNVVSLNPAQARCTRYNIM